MSRMSAKISQVFQKRAKYAKDQYDERVAKAGADLRAAAGEGTKASPQAAADYMVDFAQRTILFWDTLRQRGNQYLERERAGQPPVLHFEYEMLADGRTFPKPVNYALVRIVPPEGVKIDAESRPYVIIDPRAGHGPGIGGFKDDSQVGVALRAGHPVYFVIFFPKPEPKQTLLDVCEAEREFVRRVRRLHPKSPKPAIVGNCQGGWAAMMLAAASPDDTGPIVINGAPMSYWGGAWTEGEGDNPMRYSGGLLGGSWLASLSSDLGAGTFDAAHLVQNFENLNPANTLWDKPYHLFSNIDTEPKRYLDFERWWGGFYLMNREEIEWITQNLFVGNKLFKDKHAGGRAMFDLREIKVPIILFASMGDNITPPQQAFNWVADVYKSTDEIKARGQVIVGLLHEDIGHLGIFVSGKVAKREHTQIVHVLRSIEALAPGLYAMEITEKPGKGGEPTYEVAFREHSLEELAKRINRFKRVDEKPFEAVAKVSEFNQNAYDLFVKPWLQPMATEAGAEMQRRMHPLRAERWSISDINPFAWWLGPAASMVKANRKQVAPDQPSRKAERALSDMASASLDYYRAIRDAVSEAMFFSVYGTMFASGLEDKPMSDKPFEVDPRESSIIQETLNRIDRGGYPEAVARVMYLTAVKGKPLPLVTLELKQDLIEDYADLLPKLSPEVSRRTRGEQEVMVRHEPERALATLPDLVRAPRDRERLLMLLEKVSDDDRVEFELTREQLAMLGRIRAVLGGKGDFKVTTQAKARATAKSAEKQAKAKARAKPATKPKAVAKKAAKPKAAAKPAAKRKAKRTRA